MKKIFALKIYLILFFACCIGSGYAQNLEKFEIKGIGKTTKEKVYLMYYSFNDEEKIVDSTVIKGDKFSFKGELEGPSYGGVLFGNSLAEASNNWGDTKNIWFMIFGGDNTISFANGKPEVLKGNKGMATQLAYDTFKKEKRAVLRGDEYKADRQKVSQLQQEIKRLDSAIVLKYGTDEALEYDVLNDFLTKNPADKYSLYLLKSYLQGRKRTFEKSSHLHQLLSEDLQSSPLGKKLGHLIETLKIENGTQALDFSQTDTNGKLISLSDFKGKYVLVDFWASWCVPCRAENPNVVKAYDMFKHKNFEILGVSLDSKKENWIEAIKEDKLTWPQVSDLKGWKNEVAVLYGIRAVPSNLLIDPTGKIIAKDLREEKLLEVLREVLK